MDSMYIKKGRKGNEFNNSDISATKLKEDSAFAKSNIGVECKLDLPTDLDRPDEKDNKEEIDLKIEKKRLRVINQAKDLANVSNL